MPYEYTVNLQRIVDNNQYIENLNFVAPCSSDAIVDFSLSAEKDIKYGLEEDIDDDRPRP